MTKRAVIVVGSHNVGKSKTINKYFKPLVGLKGRQRNFTKGTVLSQSVEEREGHVLSQSLEEKGLTSIADFVTKYANKKYLVCAARPDGESLSFQKILKRELEKYGYIVSLVFIKKVEDQTFYAERAEEIYDNLNLA